MRTMYVEEEQRGESALGLFGVLATLAGGGVLLYATAGPPHLPATVPSWSTVAATLRGSDVPVEALGYIFTTAAWMLWLYIVGSLLFHLVVAIADALSHGAAWAGRLRGVSERLTIPIIRTLVDRAVVVLLVANLLGRSAGTAAAAPLPETAVVAMAPRDGLAAARPALDLHERHVETARARSAHYTVQPGDSLWGIAERFYGTGHEYKRIVDANLGHRMADGRTFDQTGVIQPGWVLDVALPSTAIEEVGDRTYYVVEDGDMLRGIAARLLGDEMRWPEIFEPNRGVARLPDGPALTNPDVIWPGLRLQIPTPPAPIVQEPSPAPQPAPPAPAPPAPVIVATPVRPDPTPEPTVIAPLPTAAPRLPTLAATAVGEVAVPAAPASTSDGISALTYGAAGLGAAAAAGGAFVFARRRARRRLSDPRPAKPTERVAPSANFADVDVARVLAHRLHGGDQEPAVLVAEYARRFFAEQGLDHLGVVVARHGRDGAGLMLRGSLADQARVLELAPLFGTRLGGQGRAWFTPDHDVMLQVVNPKLLGLVRPPSDRAPDSAWLIPVGQTPTNSAETLYANWRELGHVLIAGLPGGGAEVILTSVLAGLTARCRPDELRLWTIARGRELPIELAGLPHQARGLVDPDDEQAVARAVEDVHGELLRRIEGAREASGGESGDPEIVLVVGELDDLADHDAAIEMIGTQGADHGVRLLAATMQPAVVGEDLLSLFATRLVLQTLDDDQSVQLLGRPDGTDLGAGDLLLRVDGRIPLRARGLRVGTDHLRQLVDLMREAYGLGAAPSARTDDSDDDEDVEPALAFEDESEEVAGEEPVADSSDDDPDLEDEGTGPSTDAILVEAPEPATAEFEEDGSPPPETELADETEEIEAASVGAAQPNDYFTEPVDHMSVLAASEESHPVLDEEPDDRSEQRTSVADALRGGLTALEGDLHGHKPIIQVQCFGAFVVRSGDKEILPSGEDGARFKAWEVLAYLASQPPDSVSVDKLLDAVWPDIDKDKARNRMWTAMARLRAVLREQVPSLRPAAVLGDPVSFAVRAGRDGICRLDPLVIRSDVHEFLRLCELAPGQPPEQAVETYAKARAVYRGELLAGRNARFFDWVHDRGSATTPRDQYQEEHDRATLHLARLLREHGRAAEAIPLLKALLKDEPTLEDVVQDLFRCYRETGDLSGLIREERQLRLALRRTYGDGANGDDDPQAYEPEPETMVLFREIGDELKARSRTAERIA